MKMMIKKFFKKPYTHWQSYKHLFQVTVFKYLVTWFAIVPFFALSFKNLPQEFKIDILHTKIEYSLNLALPFSWQLLWFSSLSFVVAHILYLLFCPLFIRKYNSYRDYLDMTYSPRWIIWEAKNIFKNNMDIEKFFSRISTKKYIEEVANQKFEQIKASYNRTRKEGDDEFINYGVIIEEKQTTLYFKYNDNAFGLGLPKLNHKKKVDKQTAFVEKELFWEVFGRYSASYPTIRMVIVFLLSVSTLLFAIVFIQNIIAGLRHIV